MDFILINQIFILKTIGFIRKAMQFVQTMNHLYKIVCTNNEFIVCRSTNHDGYSTIMMEFSLLC